MLGKLYKILFKLYRLLKGDGSSNSFRLDGHSNTIQNEGVFYNVKVDVKGNNNLIAIGHNSVLNNTLIYIRGNNHRLTIENNCYYGQGELWIEDEFCTISIGESTTIEMAHIAVTEPYSKIIIGKDCMLSRHVEIRTGDSHSIIDKVTGKRINTAGDVILGNHVWIGAHTKILKGVTIGNNSIVGTCSVVTKDVPSNSIAAGIPAKVVRNEVDWCRERI